MLDKTIPFYHIIMRCDRILPMEVKLPEGYEGDTSEVKSIGKASGELSFQLEKK